MEISTSHAKSQDRLRQAASACIRTWASSWRTCSPINDLGRMLALRAAWAINTGEQEAGVLAACAKLFASEAVTKIADWGMQIFAGHGYLAGSDMERLYRDAKFGEICEGTSEMQRALDRQKRAGQVSSGVKMRYPAAG